MRSARPTSKSPSFGMTAWGGEHCTYTLQSPLIGTEKRALKVAEAILANLNRYGGLLDGDDVPQATEALLSFDDSPEDFSRQLQAIAADWAKSSLVERKATPWHRSQA